ncbi:MAG: hypothetical protein WC091_22640 [Sulfuricellaceae bacterium]
MRAIKFTSWQDDGLYIGFLNEYPDYRTQGATKAELTENLKDTAFSTQINVPRSQHQIIILLINIEQRD